MHRAVDKIKATLLITLFLRTFHRAKPSIVARENARRKGVLPRHAKIARRGHAPETAIKTARRIGHID